MIFLNFKCSAIYRKERALINKNIAAVIPAAGLGTRMGGLKQIMLLKGKPVLARTVAAFELHPGIKEIIIVAPGGAPADEIKSKMKGFNKLKSIVEGGDNRQASVFNGLQAVSKDIDGVLIHDGARPLVSEKVISDIISYVREGKSAISGVKTKDTIKIADSKNIISDTPDRDYVWLVQTPQGFPPEIIKKAHERAALDNFLGTDDSILLERLGEKVYMVEGDYKNIKLTTKEDFIMAEMLMDLREQ